MADLSDFGVEFDDDGRPIGMQSAKATALLDWQHKREATAFAAMVRGLKHKRHATVRQQWATMKDRERLARIVAAHVCSTCGRNRPGRTEGWFCSSECRTIFRARRALRAPRHLPNGYARHRLQRGESRVIMAIRAQTCGSAAAVVRALRGQSQERAVYHIVAKFLRCGFLELRGGVLRETERVSTLALTNEAKRIDRDDDGRDERKV